MKSKFLLLVAVLALAVPAFGDVFDLDYSNTTTAGSVTTFKVKGVTNEMGTGIQIGLLIVTDETTGTAVSYLVSAGDLEFNTNVPVDKAGDEITITGEIPSLSITLPTVLASGWFNSWTIAGKQFTSEATLTSSSALLTALGIGTSPFTDTGGTAYVKALGSGKASSVDVGTTVTPEPVSMMLMGTFLSLAGGLLSRKKRA